jgi:hypothetical protein
MNSSALSMELSVSVISWINDHLRNEVESRVTHRHHNRRLNVFRRFVVAGVACISVALATIIAW